MNLRLLKFAPATLVLVVFHSRSASAQWVVADPTSQGIQTSTLLENIAQSLTLGKQLAQIQESVKVAQEGLKIARDVNEGVSVFRNFNADSLLASGKEYFLANSGLGEGVNLVEDIRLNGLAGGSFDARRLGSAAYDVYMDSARRRDAEGQLEQPIDSAAALSVADLLRAVVANRAFQSKSMQKPLVTTASEGVFIADANALDPRLVESLAQSRAQSQQLAAIGWAQYLESLGASPGKAQQLAAQGATQSAHQLALLNDKQAEELAFQRLGRLEKSSAASVARKENDVLWNQIGQGLERTYSNGPKETEMPTLGAR